MNIAQLDPQIVWKHFAALCALPHPSGHEEGVRGYLLDFAAKNHLNATTDAAGNLLIRKAASAGNDTAPSVLLQGHIDMVPQKNMNVDFDFIREPIRPYIDGEWVRAEGTTLGADNGIGVAAALAVLEDRKLDHGPLGALFTVEEETGLSGALNVNPAFLNAHYLLNLDTEEEGVACIGCAGGARTDFLFKLEMVPVPAECRGVKIFVGGLLGGHSGMDINRGRGNAIKVMANLLLEAQQRFNFRISTFQGGNLDNAIPREAVVTGWVPEESEMDMGEWIKDCEYNLRLHFKESDPGVKVVMNCYSAGNMVWKAELQNQVVDALAGCANGPRSYVADIPELVETSSNLASINESEGQIVITTSQRSAVDRERDQLVERLDHFFAAHGAECRRRSSYPGWPTEKHSQLTEITERVFNQLFLRELELTAIHAGLECGIFQGKRSGIQMISIGPDILAAHSPDERVRIESVKNFYRFLTALLSALALP